MENNMEVPLKAKNRNTIWPSNLTHRQIPRENHIIKRYVHPNVHWGTIYNSQDMEATWMSFDRWMDKEDVVHIYNKILFSHKKILHFFLFVLFFTNWRFVATLHQASLSATFFPITFAHFVSLSHILVILVIFQILHQ